MANFNFNQPAGSSSFLFFSNSRNTRSAVAVAARNNNNKKQQQQKLRLDPAANLFPSSSALLFHLEATAAARKDARGCARRECDLNLNILTQNFFGRQLVRLAGAEQVGNISSGQKTPRSSMFMHTGTGGRYASRQVARTTRRGVLLLSSYTFGQSARRLSPNATVPLASALGNHLSAARRRRAPFRHFHSDGLSDYTLDSRDPKFASPVCICTLEKPKLVGAKLVGERRLVCGPQFAASRSVAATAAPPRSADDILRWTSGKQVLEGTKVGKIMLFLPATPASS